MSKDNFFKKLFGKLFRKNDLEKVSINVSGNDREWFDYAEAIKRFPWLLEKKRLFVVSPDADGFYCALLLTHFKRWKCVGFYNDRVLLLKNGVDENEVVYVDVEMFDGSKKSMGNHSLLPRTIKKFKKEIDEGFAQCFNPNLIRGVCHGDYNKKYPFGTAHMLLSILAYESNGKLSNFLDTPQKIVAFVYADGMLKNGLKYPENGREWLEYLRFNEEWNPLKGLGKITYGDIQLENIMFHKKIHEHDTTKQRGDKLSITSNGNIHACYEKENGLYAIKEENKNGMLGFLRSIHDIFELEFEDDLWDCWDDLSMTEYDKVDDAKVTNESFKEMFEKNPVSYAVTSTQKLSYTLRKKTEN